MKFDFGANAFDTETFNSLRPTLVTHIYDNAMACHWFKEQHVSCQASGLCLNHSWLFVNWNCSHVAHWTSNRNTSTFVYENAFENVICTMTAFLLRFHCVQYIQISIYILYFGSTSRVPVWWVVDSQRHDDVIKWNIFRVTGLLCGEFTGHRWTGTKGSDAELLCVLWSAPEQKVEKTIVTPVIRDAVAPIMTSL